MTTNSISPRKYNSFVIVDDTSLLSDSGIYCAKRCGRGCTFAEYQKVINEAKALKEELGDDWEVEVWDNLGWKYMATNGMATISPPSKHTGSQWGCIINIPNMSGISASGNSPKEAGRNAANLVAESIREMLSSFNTSTHGVFGSIEINHIKSIKEAE